MTIYAYTYNSDSTLKKIMLQNESKLSAVIVGARTALGPGNYSAITGRSWIK